MSNKPAPLAGLRVLDVSILGPGATAHHFAELGADVIKIEAPGGDYVRMMTWPIIDGISLLHWHIARGKKSIELDLKTPEGVEIFKELAKDADIVIEAMRPGALKKRGLGYEELKKINPKIVFCCVSGYGMTGPYENMPSHGVAYDTWAGCVEPARDEDGFVYLPAHASIGMHAGPLLGAFAALAAVVRARETGEGSMMEIGQSDGAAYMDWYRIESYKAYTYPQERVTGNQADDYRRRPVGTAGLKEGVRYQAYECKDGYILFMASEQVFWKNFCEGVGRMDMYEKWPGKRLADHAPGNKEMQKELTEIFKTKTIKEWMDWGVKVNTPIAPVYNSDNMREDEHFKARFKWYGIEEHGADMISYPVHFIDEELPEPTKAPTPGQHRDEILKRCLHYDEARIAELEAKGAFGHKKD
ncbi:MAG: CoA transferase [Pseudomonadales bacterium]|nr:CoA transferase [Pseudomonadales bacterium]